MSRPAPQVVRRPPDPAGRLTLLMMGVGPRLAGATVLAVLIWAAVAWALAEVA
ncbi:MAG: hypothetical protein RLY78_1984 [Pseudomonadota bacterium]|jgi:hypothetical protein|uniref:Uncharacterized protein n=1 Tax=Pseudaquabacterium rugosum TaxID=2984194 RepID=A0ABU9BCF2_9BURK